MTHSSPAPAPVALLGTGHLGGAIGQRLLSCGHPLTVWNRTPQRAEALVTAGACLASTPAAAVASAGLVVSVLSDGSTTRDQLESCAPALKGRLLMQIATIAPQESRCLGRWLAEQGCEHLEAPVLGSKPEALAGRLLVMTAGPEAALRRADALVAALSEQPTHLGDWGQALIAKLALNQLIASLTHAFSLSLHLVQRSGVSVEAFMDVLRPSALHAPTFDKKLPRMLSGDYAGANFPLAHLNKDLTLFLQSAREAGLNAAGLTGLQQLLESPAARDAAGLDYSALHGLTAHQLAGMQP
ncbi:NAD(P)-dependent oxidoreductase [Synechococcus sp. RSCCF101]|uniref:NAD(P)-dependent oxidoreductase n=1 Tax=Synechococcus sp. RSCCF101 TaxID=2511069 RepID=UPI001248E644|nr:NAD(P)-dependent oxidoreductase [Synechococcus sp. RSCCF101]QEY32007.1 NAD(P)-dependent oxidoreductase [Synechococcus sp. RSCCF101]